MADVATLGLKVDASGALQGIGAVETKLQKLEASANQAGALIGKAFLAGGAALGALGALVIKNTAEADAAFAQLSATVKSTGGVAGFTAEQLRDTAGALQNVSVFGDEAVQSMQAVLLTFRNVRGDQFTQASSAILDLAQALGTDLKSAAIQVGKALQDPIGGISGLGRAGVQFSDSQKAVIEQMMAVGDIAGAQTVILKELETQFGGSALAARNTMGGALAALRNAFGDLLEVPSIIAPVTVSLNAMVDVLKDPAVVQGVKTFVQDTVFLLGSLAQAFLELTAVAIDTVGGLARLFGKLSPSNSPLNQAADAADRWSAALVNTAYAIEGIQTRIAEFTPSVTKAGKAVAIATPQVDALTKAVKLQDEAVSEGATAWYEFFKSLESTAPMQTVADNFGDLVEVIEPKEEQASAWSNFLGWLSTEAQFTTDNLGSAFAQTFQNIAARGKATMGDLFATIGGMFKAGSAGSAIFGGLGVAGSVVGGALANRNAEVEQAKAAREQFQKEITAFNEMLARWATDIGGYATDLDAAIESINRTFNDQAKQLRDIFEHAANQTINVDTAKNLDAYNKAYAALVKLRDDEIKRVTELNEKKKAEFADEIAIRSLLVAGLNDQAELVRQEIAQAKELAEAKRLGIDTTELEILQLKERNKLQEKQERDRGFTLAGLDAAIAREGGNTDLADQIERDIERQKILAEVTDATIKAKYEELWAIQDTNRAAKEAAEAIQLLANQAAILEDLEVRKLMATGKTMEAEELRFQLEQKRELARAEADFAAGLITQDILDQLREVLGLEATAFGNRNQPAGEAPSLGGSANPLTRGSTQTMGSFAGAQVQDIDRVVGELSTIRVRSGQVVSLLTQLVRGGGIVGAVNNGLQNTTSRNQILTGNIVVS